MSVNYYIQHIPTGQVVNSRHYQSFYLCGQPLLFETLKNLKKHINTVNNDKRNKRDRTGVYSYLNNFSYYSSGIRPVWDSYESYFAHEEEYSIVQVDFEKREFINEIPMQLFMKIKDLSKFYVV